MSGAGMALAKLFDQLDTKPIHEIMRDNERAAGRRVIVPGDETWLPAEDWHETVVVSQDGRVVRLIAILAKKPGAGAFSRMAARILASGLMPVVIYPTREFRAALTRRGWTMQVVGSGEEQEEHWRPRRKSRRTAA